MNFLRIYKTPNRLKYPKFSELFPDLLSKCYFLLRNCLLSYTHSQNNMMWHIAYANILQKQILAIAGLLDLECKAQKMKGTVSGHI